MNQRAGKTAATDWSVLGYAFSILLMAFINGGAGYVADVAVMSGQRADVERAGKIVVSRDFRNQVRGTLKTSQRAPTVPPTVNLGFYVVDYAAEARRIAEREVETRVRSSRSFALPVAAQESVTLYRRRRRRRA